MTLRTIQGGPDSPLQRGRADYLWLDPGGVLHTKLMAIGVGKDERGDPTPLVPRTTLRNEIILCPAHVIPNPLLEQPSFLVLCETRDVQDHCLEWNHRAKLRALLKAGDRSGQWWGFRQAFIFKSNLTCFADSLVGERFFGACLDAGLLIHSRSSVHFNLGPRGFTMADDRDATAVLVADHLIFARFLLERIGLAHDAFPAFLPIAAYVSTGPLRAGISGSAESMAIQLEGRFPEKTLDANRGGVRCLKIPSEFTDPYRLLSELVPLLDR